MSKSTIKGGILSFRIRTRIPHFKETLDPDPLIMNTVRIRIHRIRVFLGLLDPDPLVRGMDPDPDPSISKQKWKEKP